LERNGLPFHAPCFVAITTGLSNKPYVFVRFTVFIILLKNDSMSITVIM
jgi:hypothetical protein